MEEVTLNAIEELVDRVFDKKLEPIKTILDNHTTSLDLLLTKKQVKDEEKIVATHRFERLEKWARRVGDQLGIKIEF